MPSKLYHITRRRKNALGNLIKSKFSIEHVEKAREEADILRHRIAGGAHSSNWYKKQSRKKPVVTENEAA